MILVNMKLHFGGCNSITFQGYRLHRSDSFLMAQLKQVAPEQVSSRMSFQLEDEVLDTSDS